MIGGVLAFFASGALRLFIGEVMAFFTSKQDHAQELDRMRLQGDLDTERATQQRMAMSLQKELGVEIIEAQGSSVKKHDKADGRMAGRFPQCDDATRNGSVGDCDGDP
jgi:hypothetical protein